MIAKWFVTGDCHRDFSRFSLTKDDTNFKNDNSAAVIILGDAGINYLMDSRDSDFKNSIVNKYKCYFYCVRGNHEARPQDISGMKLVYDENVNGDIYMQDEWPTIRYFKDWGIYTISNYKVAVIGGAYSVDKWYRLNRVGITSVIDPQYLNPKISGWFPNEQLNSNEMTDAMIELENGKYDFIFTHTCPIEWEPTDLFLNSISQDKVDKSMEHFLTGVRKSIDWDVWCFGHYHGDRLERPFVEMYYKYIENIDTIWKRWMNYEEYNELDWWLVKSPNFYMI